MTLALVQARMQSRRLPGKSMAPLAGVPLIEHVVKRVQAATTVDRVCVCTTSEPFDDPLAAHVESLGVAVYRGDSKDVLARFYWAAEGFPEENPLVRITADDPFIDHALIDKAVYAFVCEWGQPDEKLGAPEYLQLGGVTWPLGMGCEVFTREALRLAHQRATRKGDREHVTPWMQRNFFHWVLKDDEQRKSVSTRWTIDTQDDLAFAEKVYEFLYPQNPLFGYADLLAAGY